MPQGLQVWDAAGNLMIDTNTWHSQVLGNFTLGASHAAGSLVDANLALVRPFIFVLPNEGNEGGTAGGNPTANIVTISGTTVSWNAALSACQVVYGIY